MVIVCCFASATWAETRTINNLDNGISQTILMLGTSNYVEAGNSWFSGGSWISQTRSILSAEYGSLVNIVSRPDGGGDIRTGLTHVAGDMQSIQPTTVVLGYAINDAATCYYDPLHPDILSNNIRSMVQTIYQYNPNAEIIFHNFMSPEDVTSAENPSGAYDSRSARPDHEQVLSLYDEVASEFGILHINSYQPWEDLRIQDRSTYISYSWEGVHPNVQGNMNITTPYFLEQMGFTREISQDDRTYVPATTANTSPGDAITTDSSQWANGSDNLWAECNVWDPSLGLSTLSAIGEDAPTITTTVEGLDPSKTYEVFLRFIAYNGASIQGGLSGNPLELCTYLNSLDTGYIPMSGFSLLEHSLGTVSGSSFSVEIAPFGPESYYAGLSYIEIPEPMTLVLLSMGGLLLRRRRKA